MIYFFLFFLIDKNLEFCMLFIQVHEFWESPVTCHLTTTLCSFSYYESPRRLGDVAFGGLVVNRVKERERKKCRKPTTFEFLFRQFKEQPHWSPSAWKGPVPGDRSHGPRWAWLRRSPWSKDCLVGFAESLQIWEFSFFLLPNKTEWA